MTVSNSINRGVLLIIFFCVLLQTRYLYAENAFIIDNCIEMLNLQRQGKALNAAKASLKKDRWNAEANACLAIAYYQTGREHQAFKGLKEAEDSLPKEVIANIHDIIWERSPELLAEKEYRDNFTLSGGACILHNVTSINGNGFFIIGKFFNPETSSTGRHLRAFQCNDSHYKDCAAKDIVCPDCALVEQEAEIRAMQYRIVDIKQTGKTELLRNIRYISKILELERKRLGK